MQELALYKNCIIIIIIIIIKTANFSVGMQSVVSDQNDIII